MKVLFTSILLPLLISIQGDISAALSLEDCKSLLVDVDSCYQKIVVFGDPQFPKFTSASVDLDVQTHCKQVRNSLKCVKNYGKCMRNVPKMLFNIVYGGARKEVNNRCNSLEGRKDFMKHTLSMSSKKDVYDKIVYKLINYYDYATLNLTAGKQLSNLCCGYQYFREELYGKIKELSNEDDAIFAQKSMHILYSDLLEFSCGQYSDIKKCREILPESTKIYESMKTQSNTGIIIPLVRFTRTMT